MRFPTLAALPFLLLAACDDDGASQPAARDRVTDAVCDRLQACGELRAGGTYATRDDCEVDQRAFWNRTWPAEECDTRIAPDQLDLCLAAIDIAECGNALDVANVLLNKCTKEKVCSRQGG